MCSRRPRARVGQLGQKSTRDAPCACALERETSLGAICGHVHSCVQRQAFGGWEPRETWGCSPAPKEQGRVLQCLKCPVTASIPPLQRAAWFTGTKRIQMPLPHVVSELVSGLDKEIKNAAFLFEIKVNNFYFVFQ